VETAAGEDVRIVWLLVVLASVLVVAVAALIWRRIEARGRLLGHAGVGMAASAFVFGLQSGSVGASLTGGVLSLACGAMAVLVLMLIRSV
jgi:hypothetical protein